MKVRPTLLLDVKDALNWINFTSDEIVFLVHVYVKNYEIGLNSIGNG